MRKYNQTVLQWNVAEFASGEGADTNIRRLGEDRYKCVRATIRTKTFPGSLIGCIEMDLTPDDGQSIGYEIGMLCESIGHNAVPFRRTRYDRHRGLKLVGIEFRLGDKEFCDTALDIAEKLFKQLDIFGYPPYFELKQVTHVKTGDTWEPLGLILARKRGLRM